MTKSQSEHWKYWCYEDWAYEPSPYEEWQNAQGEAEEYEWGSGGVDFDPDREGDDDEE